MLTLGSLVFASLCLPLSQCHTDSHDISEDTVPVLVIAVDSFRWNFIERLRLLRKEAGTDQSRFWALIEKGAYAREGIQSAFPTTTAPSLHTLATGLFAENHGVVSDVVYDSNLNLTAHLKSRRAENAWVFGGEPIWKTFERQAVQHYASGLVGCYMWTGCEHGGVSKSVQYKWNTIWHDRVDKAIDWLRDGLRLILVSSPDIDSIGRTDGPDSSSMDDALLRFDADIAYLVKRLEDEKFIDRINLVIVSGHGITKAVQEQPLLPRNAPEESIIWSRAPTMWLVEPVDDENETIAYFKQFEHLRVFRKSNVPEEWNYRHHLRIPSIVVLAETGYFLSEASDQHHKGFYGYNNSISDMRGTIVGFGPAFLANSSIPNTFSTVDVYQLLCILLDMAPAPNNGSIKDFSNFVHPNYLKRLPAWSSSRGIPWSPVIILVVLLVSGIAMGSWLCYRSGECNRGRHVTDQSQPRAITVDSIAQGEKAPIIHKYESELVILELDDGQSNP